MEKTFKDKHTGRTIEVDTLEGCDKYPDYQNTFVFPDGSVGIRASKDATGFFSSCVAFVRYKKVRLDDTFASSRVAVTVTGYPDTFSTVPGKARIRGVVRHGFIYMKDECPRFYPYTRFAPKTD